VTDRVRGVGPVERRTGDRRQDERRDGAPRASKALVPVDEVRDETPAPAKPAATPPATEPSPSAFAAQMLGQGGEKRGLKGGPPVLDGARAAYLSAEYAGPGDRRPKPGRATKTDL